MSADARSARPRVRLARAERKLKTIMKWFARLVNSICHEALLWGSFLAFILLDVLVLYGVCKYLKVW